MPAIELEPPSRDGAIDVNGRRVGWRAWGPADGELVLLCSGAAMTGSLGLARGACADTGTHLVCVDRAGLGRSAPDPDKSLTSHAADVDRVLDALGASTARVLGTSQGAPFAVAVSRLPRVRACALVSPQDELAHPSMRPLLNADLAGLVDAAVADAAGFEAFMLARGVDADGMHQLVLAMSAEIDRARYGEPAFEAAYRATLVEAFAQGGAGYVRDLALALGRWAVAPESITVPTMIWVGTLDTSPVHSPDLARTLSTRIPGAVRRVVEGEGGSLLWTQTAEILRELRAA